MVKRPGGTKRLEGLPLRHLATSIPDAFLIATGEGQVVFVNSHAARAFGYSRDEIVGLSVDALVPERYRERPTASTARPSSPGQAGGPWARA